MNPIIYLKAASPLLGNAHMRSWRWPVDRCLILHPCTCGSSSYWSRVWSVPEKGEDYLLYRVLQAKCRATSNGAPQSSSGWWGACNRCPRIFPWWRHKYKEMAIMLNSGIIPRTLRKVCYITQINC